MMKLDVQNVSVSLGGPYDCERRVSRRAGGGICRHHRA